MAKYQTNKTKRTVYNTIRCIGVLLFGNNERYKQPKFIENAVQKSKYQELLRMIDTGKLNEAENELIADIEFGVAASGEAEEFLDSNQNLLELALHVYGYMNEKDDEFLQENSYSREEIEDGVFYVMQIMGLEISGIVDICR